MPLDMLEFIWGSGPGNRSLWIPSRMCMFVRIELVAVADCRKNEMVLWNKVRSSSSSMQDERTVSLKAAERTRRFPHWACAVPKTFVMIGRLSPRPWKALVLSMRALTPFLASSTTWGSMSPWVLVLGWMTGAITSCRNSELTTGKLGLDAWFLMSCENCRICRMNGRYVMTWAPQYLARSLAARISSAGGSSSRKAKLGATQCMPETASDTTPTFLNLSLPALPVLLGSSGA